MGQLARKSKRAPGLRPFRASLKCAPPSAETPPVSPATVPADSSVCQERPFRGSGTRKSSSDRKSDEETPTLIEQARWTQTDGWAPCAPGRMGAAVQPVLEERVEEEVEDVRDVLGGRAVLTARYSCGEIAPHATGAGLELQKQTMVATTFAER